MAVASDGRRPMTVAEWEAILPACQETGFPVLEAVNAVEHGWPGFLVQRAILESEAVDAIGIDHWLAARGWVSLWRAREEDDRRPSPAAIARARRVMERHGGF